MRKYKKIIMSLLLTSSLLIVSGTPVNAASSGTWNVNYHPGATSDISNQVSNVVVSYYSGGYIANCSTISGTNGRALTISSSSAGGMSTISVTTTGLTRSWKMNGSTKGNVTFDVIAASGHRCQSTGTIKIFN